MADLDQLQITEDAIDNEWDREHHDVILRQVGRGERIQRIGNDGHTGNDRNVLVEKRDGISIEHLAVRAGSLCKQVHFSPAFSQPNVEGEQDRDHIQPRRKPLDGRNQDDPRRHTQNKAG